MQDRGSSDRSSQSLLPLHQRSMGKQKDPGWFLLPHRNSEMSQLLLASPAVDGVAIHAAVTKTPTNVHPTFILASSYSLLQPPANHISPLQLAPVLQQPFQHQFITVWSSFDLIWFSNILIWLVLIILIQLNFNH